MAALPYLIVVAFIAVFFVWPAWRSFRREEAEAREALDAAERAGRREPVSLRPWVDPEKCMGSGSCVKACPEKQVLRVLDGMARLVQGADCVGHGACARACPTGAIELVFGSERRGVDIPAIGPDFQSDVPGLFVAGELGGMGLIANAVQQGVQAVGQVARGLRPAGQGVRDLVIVGAGPAGLGAALEAKRRGMNCLLLDQDEFGGAVRHYPRRKLVMSRGFQLPGSDRVKSGTMRKEELVALFTDAVKQGGLDLRERVRVTDVQRGEDGLFTVLTEPDLGPLRASRVLLAVGRRGTPRRLGVPGEDREKVAYRLLDPEQFRHSHVLVVGGGDSAVEAACSLAEEPGTRVTLSYRKDSLSRPRPANRARVETLAEAGRVNLVLGSQVSEIAEDRVKLRVGADEQVLANDAVFVFAGGVLPWEFLKRTGIRAERHFGKRVESADGR